MLDEFWAVKKIVATTSSEPTGKNIKYIKDDQ
jgi:hypothetical protein